MDRTIDYVKEVGYDGLEIAPYTLSRDVKDISTDARAAVARKAEAAGLDIIGLHWLLVGPEGLHLNSPQKDIRDRTAQYLIDLARLCADVGGKIMVFGSPEQRSVDKSLTHEQALDYSVEVFEKALPACEACGVTLCMEPLTHRETNFCQTAEETVRLIDRIDHPNFRLLLDTKAMAFEERSRAQLIRDYGPYLAHYHANDENLKGPGAGDVEFAPIFEALRSISYEGYVSVEVFDFEDGPEAIATKSLQYMKDKMAALV